MIAAAEPPPMLIFLAVAFGLGLLVSGLWWFQATMAARGDRENPGHPGGDERLGELEHEQRAALASVKVAAIVCGGALVLVVLSMVS